MMSMEIAMQKEFLLTDKQMAQFIGHGYIKIETPLGKNFHQKIFDEHKMVFEKEQLLLIRVFLRDCLTRPSVFYTLY